MTGKPNGPPKKLYIPKTISRAQSLKSPRTSSPQSPDKNNVPNFAANVGTVRNLSAVLNSTLAQSMGSLPQKPRPTINTRPTAPPPSIPQFSTPPPPPPSSTSTPQQTNSTPPPPPTKMIKPIHAPPPPPPQHAPPPPPSRIAPRPPPAVRYCHRKLFYRQS